MPFRPSEERDPDPGTLDAFSSRANDPGDSVGDVLSVPQLFHVFESPPQQQDSSRESSEGPSSPVGGIPGSLDEHPAHATRGSLEHAGGEHAHAQQYFKLGKRKRGDGKDDDGEIDAEDEDEDEEEDKNEDDDDDEHDKDEDEEDEEDEDDDATNDDTSDALQQVVSDLALQEPAFIPPDHGRQAGWKRTASDSPTKLYAGDISWQSASLQFQTKMTDSMFQALLAYREQNPGVQLKTMKDFIANNYGVDISVSAINMRINRHFRRGRFALGSHRTQKKCGPQYSNAANLRSLRWPVTTPAPPTPGIAAGLVLQKTAGQLFREIWPNKLTGNYRLTTLLADRPAQRLPEIGAGRLRAGLTDYKVQNVAAWLMQAAGDARPPGHGCTKCERGKGVFVGCVTLADGHGVRLTWGACASCRYGGKGSACSLLWVSPDQHGHEQPGATIVAAQSRSSQSPAAALPPSVTNQPACDTPSRSSAGERGTIHPVFAAAQLADRTDIKRYERQYEQMPPDELRRALRALLRKRDDIDDRLAAINRISNGILNGMLEGGDVSGRT